MRNSTVYSLVLAGGASSRLFPMNKILADLCGTGESLLQQAMARAQVLTDRPNIRVLSVQSMALPIAKQLKLPLKQVLVDPVRRGTWPAILWAMAQLPQSSSQAVMAVLTGDHLIPQIGAFRKAAQKAIRLAAEQDAFVLLGVEPDAVAQTWTGFGVFQTGKNGGVTRFAEKPALAQAHRMIRQGNWQWNSGMFFFRVSTAIQAMQRYQPTMFRVYLRMCEAISSGDLQKAEAIYADFPDKISHPLNHKRLVDNTIDFAIMTPLINDKPKDLKAFSVSNGLPKWTDIGQWGALRDILKKDRWGNVRIGRVQVDRSVRNCILAADRGHTLKIRDLQDHVVAVSDLGELRLPIAKLPDIKTYVQDAPLKAGRRIVRIAK